LVGWFKTMVNFSLSREQSGLLVVDVQDKLFEKVENPCGVLNNINKTVKGFQLLNLPIIATEQYPKGLGETVASLKVILGENQQRLSKTTFSCFKDEDIKKKIVSSNISQWVLVGIEAHVCILQTAKDLINAGKQVVVLNDAISSRSIFDYSTAIAELRDCGARISSTETVLFELIQDSKAPEFKQMSQLIQCSGCC